jgi:4'-phosphopantetheinyl transferase
LFTSTITSLVPDPPASVVVWIARASGSVAAEWSSVLPSALLAEFRRFSPTECHRRIVRAAMRRSVLASLVGVAPHELELPRRHGRPLPPPGLGGSLSASHHDDLTALGLSSSPRLGIDVEPRCEADWDAALDDVITGCEREQLARLPGVERPSAYFRLWTLKEAVMKALGEGLSLRAPSSVEIILGEHPRLARLDGEPPAELWALRSVDVCGHLLSVAVPGSGGLSLELRRWPMSFRGEQPASLSENQTHKGRKSR